VSGALPYLKTGLTWLPTKIDSSRYTVEKGEMRFQLRNDEPQELADPTKTTTQEEDDTLPGRFLDRLLSRNPNTKGRIVRFYRGIQEVNPTDWELKFTGKIEDVNWTEDGAEFRVVDLLYKLGEIKTPNKISSTNTLLTTYNGGATMDVVDVSEFEDATTNEPKTVKVEDELVSYTGKNTGLNQLTGCTAGAYGTAPVAHGAGTKVEQALVYATAAYADGYGFDRIVMDLLVNRGKVPVEYIDMVDYGVTLAAALGVGVSTATLSNTVDLPTQGVIKIDDELIVYQSKNDTTNTLTGLLRGMYTTTDVAHLINANVYLTKFTEQSNTWFVHPLFRTKIFTSQSVKTIMQNLAESCHMDVWQNEQSFVTCALQAPPIPGAITPPTLRVRDTGLNTRKVDRNEDGRFTRVSVYFNTNDAWPGKSPEKFDGLFLDVGVLEESPEVYGEKVEKVFYSNFLYRESDALWLVLHIFSKYRAENPIVDFYLEFYNETLKVGDLVYLEIPERVDADGAYLTRLYKTTFKKIVDMSRTAYKAQDAGFADNRYSLIGPSQPILNANMTAVQLTMNVDVSETTLTLADFQTGGVHALKILSPATSNELITYTGITDLGGGVFQFTGLTRDADGALGGGVIHAIGNRVPVMYSSMSIEFQTRYGFQGDVTGPNMLAPVSYTPNTDDGYKIW